MPSLYLNSLSVDTRTSLEQRLWQSQGKVCFICQEPIDLIVHKGALDIDHIVPLRDKGKDDETNFAITHASCNRSKQASNLSVARIIAHFDKLKNGIESQEERAAHLGDLLSERGGSKYSLNVALEGDNVRYSFPEIGDNRVIVTPLFQDKISGFKSFFADVPIEYLYHDTKINPRGIGSNLRKLIEEFYKKNPQLQVALARYSQVEKGSEDDGKVLIFDGQHKAAAQVLLDNRRVLVRVFLDPELDVLLAANTNAGDSLRQVAFDLSVRRQLGSTQFTDRIAHYQKDRGLPENIYDFSERDLVDYFKGEGRSVKKYVLDAVRDGIISNRDNELREYIDFAGKGKTKPLSYSTIDKTFFSFFIYPSLLTTPLDFKMDAGENPRELEKSQIIKLMNIIAEEIYKDQFDFERGTSRIESYVQKKEDKNISDGHLRAFRMSKEEIIYTWLKYTRDVIKLFFLNQGLSINEEKLFQHEFPEQLWTNLRCYINNLKGLPIWVNRELSVTVFGGKQTKDFWEEVFTNGVTPQGQRVMASGIVITNMIVC
ncbi:MAG: HNH endonuclease signature motif containing protein [Patescibacteria group bacterium]